MSVVLQGKSANIQGSPQPELQTMEPTSDSLDSLNAQPQSPLPESEYDKLLVSRTEEAHSLSVLPKNLSTTLFVIKVKLIKV